MIKIHKIKVNGQNNKINNNLQKANVIIYLKIKMKNGIYYF